MKITAIIPAAGTGSRYSSSKNKLLDDLFGMPVLARTLKTVSSVETIENIIICTSIDLIEDIKKLVSDLNIQKVSGIILGGKTRQESVFLGLKEAEKQGSPEIIIIHDGARPLIKKETIDKSIKCAKAMGASIVAVPTKDTIKKVCPNTGKVLETIDRQTLWNIQTPQTFKFKDLFDAHIKYRNKSFTDDSALIEASGGNVFVTRGEYENIKITTPGDIELAKNFIKESEKL